MLLENNPMFRTASGRVGSVYFRHLRGKTVVSSMPKKPDPSKQTTAQRGTRNAFKLATAFAKECMADPEKKAWYTARAKKLKLPNGYTAAITYYMRTSQEAVVNKKKYTGKTGGEIGIAVPKKKIPIQNVYVTLLTSDGEILEDGNATRHVEGMWIYMNRAAVNNPADVIVKVRITDANGLLI